MAIQRINQVISGIDKLLEQFKGKYNIESVLTTYLEQSQSTQTCYEEMLDERSIFVAIGVQLDMIGQLVGQPRGGRNDDDYRVAILIKIAINTSTGTLPDIHDIIKSYAGADSVEIFEHFPAGIYVYIDGGNPTSALVAVVENILPAGVNLGYIGFSDNDLILTPYDQEYSTDTLVADVGGSIDANTGQPITIKVETATVAFQKAWLAEYSEYIINDLIDDVGDNIVDETADLIVVNAEEVLPTSIYGIAAETL